MQTPFIPSDDTTQQIAYHIEQILRLMGENAEREGLVKTPTRVGEAMQFLTQGYQQNAEDILRGALFEEDYRGAYYRYLHLGAEFVLARDFEVELWGEGIGSRPK